MRRFPLELLIALSFVLPIGCGKDASLDTNHPTATARYGTTLTDSGGSLTAASVPLDPTPTLSPETPNIYTGGPALQIHGIAFIGNEPPPLNIPPPISIVHYEQSQPPVPQRILSEEEIRWRRLYYQRTVFQPPSPTARRIIGWVRYKGLNAPIYSGGRLNKRNTLKDD